MKLQRHIHNDKIHYDIIPRTRLVIPLREYEEIRKKIYRSPKYWFEEIYRLVVWAAKTSIGAHLAAFLICLFIVINSDLSGVGLNSLFPEVWRLSQPLAFCFLVVIIIKNFMLSLYPFGGAVYQSHLDDLIAREYEGAITSIENLDERQEGK